MLRMRRSRTQFGWDARFLSNAGAAILLPQEQMTPQQLGDFTKKELVYWGKVIQGAKITLE